MFTKLMEAMIKTSALLIIYDEVHMVTMIHQIETIN
jgi:hypothetical protein